VKLTASYNVPAGRERVFAAMTDPAVLQRCIEGCESLTLQPDGSYAAQLRVGLGSIKGSYSGTARMSDVQAPESYTLAVSGRGTPGFVNGTAQMRLVVDGQETVIACDADVAVGGAIAAIGSRLIEVAAKRMMDRFFACLAREFS